MILCIFSIHYLHVLMPSQDRWQGHNIPYGMEIWFYDHIKFQSSLWPNFQILYLQYLHGSLLWFPNPSNGGYKWTLCWLLLQHSRGSFPHYLLGFLELKFFFCNLAVILIHHGRRYSTSSKGLPTISASLLLSLFLFVKSSSQWWQKFPKLLLRAPPSHGFAFGHL
mgnify:CR=1 FL=1